MMLVLLLGLCCAVAVGAAAAVVVRFVIFCVPNRYQTAEAAFQTAEAKQYLNMEALVFQEIENKNLYICELERDDPSDKLGAQFDVSATFGFWGFRSRQFVSIKSIGAPIGGFKHNVPVLEVRA